MFLFLPTKKISINQAKILCIFLLALIVRLYKVTNEPLDWHAFRQADTASVTREYVKHGVDFFKPTYHDLSNIQSGKDNLNGLRMVEFPLVNGLLAYFIRATNSPIALTSRLFSIFCSLGAMVFLYKFVQKISSNNIALITIAIFAILPYSIYYSRAILPEPSMLFFSLASFYYYADWVQKRHKFSLLLSTIFLSASLLMKPFVIFITPVYLAVTWFFKGKNFWKEWSLLVMGILALAPFAIWRKWISQFPEGIPANTWLLNGNGIRLRPAWFRWLFWERLTKLMSGYVQVILIPFNFQKVKKDLVVYGSWWLGILAYFIVVASGNVQHDYYQVLVLPILCISLARGAVYMTSLLQKFFSKNLAVSTVTGIIILGCAASWTTSISGYFNINHPEYIEAGKAVDSLTPPDAKIIAPAFGDTMFLYQTNRTGWPIGFEIDKKISLGATHYISTSYDDEARMLEKKYKTIKKTQTYILLDLTQKN